MNDRQPSSRPHIAAPIFAAMLLFAGAAGAQTAGPQKAPWEGPPCSKEKTVVAILLPKSGHVITTSPGKPPTILIQGRLRNFSCAKGMANIDPDGWKVRFFLKNQLTKQVTPTDEHPVLNGYVLLKSTITESMIPVGAHFAKFAIHGEVVAPFKGPPFLASFITVYRQFPPAIFPNFGDTVFTPTIVSPTPNSLVQPLLPGRGSWPGTQPAIKVIVNTTIPPQQCTGAKISVSIGGATGYSAAKGPVFAVAFDPLPHGSAIGVANCSAGTKSVGIVINLKPPFKAAGGWVRAYAWQTGPAGNAIGVSPPTQFKLDYGYTN